MAGIEGWTRLCAPVGVSPFDDDSFFNLPVTLLSIWQFVQLPICHPYLFLLSILFISIAFSPTFNIFPSSFSISLHTYLSIYYFPPHLKQERNSTPHFFFCVYISIHLRVYLFFFLLSLHLFLTVYTSVLLSSAM